MLTRIRNNARRIGARGYTLAELVTVLAVIGVLSAVLIPVTLNYLEDAKSSKALNDVTIIGGALINLTRDVAHFPLFQDGTRTTGEPDWHLLVGPGNPPLDHDSEKWGLDKHGKIDELKDHLVENKPGSQPYETATTATFRWKGPYLTKISEDPWGNHYVVNIKNGDPADTPAKVIWVLSAGPNGKIETDRDAKTDSGPDPKGDDIAVRIK